MRRSPVASLLKLATAPAARAEETQSAAATAVDAVRINALSKVFGTGLAVDNVSMAIGERRFVSIVGPSGCGKSTVLRMVSGLVPPTSGEIYLRGKEVSGPAKGISMVFQAPVLLPWRTLLDNILFSADMRGERVSRYRERAHSLIKLAGLEGFENSYPHELSGGMQQRTSICRALLLEPTLLLMDEPFGALDIITRERMGFELQKIWLATRNTVVFVTHSIIEAALLSDTVIVMSGRPGKIKAVIDVPLPRPRTTATLIDPEFVRITAQLREHIEAQWAE